MAPSFDHIIVNSHLLYPLYLSYLDTSYVWFSFLCVPNLHSTNLNIHFTLYYVSWRVWFLDLQTVTYIFYLIFYTTLFLFVFFLSAMILFISPLRISLLSSCSQMLLLSFLSSWCYSCSYHLSSSLLFSFSQNQSFSTQVYNRTLFQTKIL